jgi:hypothetical protein
VRQAKFNRPNIACSCSFVMMMLITAHGCEKGQPGRRISRREEEGMEDTEDEED